MLKLFEPSEHLIHIPPGNYLRIDAHILYNMVVMLHSVVPCKYNVQTALAFDSR